MPLWSLFIIIENISDIRPKHVGGLNYHHLETWHWHGKYGSRLNITTELSHILCTFVVLLYCNLYGFIVMRWLTMVITIKSTCLQNPFPTTCMKISFPLNFDLNQSSFILVSSHVWIKTALHHNKKVVVLLTNCFKTFFNGLALVAYIALEISTDVTFRVG